IALALSVGFHGSLHAPGNAGAGATRSERPARAVNGAAGARANAVAATAPAQGVEPVVAANLTVTSPPAPAKPGREDPVPELAGAKAPPFCYRVDAAACAAAARECAAKLLDIRVCRHMFEAPDPRWAPDAEQQIRELVAEMDLLQLRASAPFT